jgi:hypothetical protein
MGSTGGLHRSFRSFLKLRVAIFFEIFMGSYVKIHRHWGFRVDYYEVQGPFLENYGLQTYFPGSLGVYM